jgi:hypothetical protein
MKKNLGLKVIYVLAFLFIMSNCVYDRMDFKLKITNNSNADIYFFDTFSYPDTSIRVEYNPTYSKTEYFIKNGETKSVVVRGTWDESFKIWDTLIIFIYDAKTLETTPWDSIRKNYLILKRFDLTLQSLENLNWIISFPSTGK